MSQRPENFIVEPDGELKISVYGPWLQSVTIRPESNEIPLRIGATFTCTVVAIEHKVVER